MNFQFFTTLTRIARTAANSLWRNRGLSLAATLVMTLTLFTISFFASLLIMVNSTTELLRSKVDIAVYFNDTASKDQILAIENVLHERSDIKKVDYISKEEALKRWRERNVGDEGLAGIITDVYNPLPRSLEIKTEHPEDIEGVNTFLSSDDYKPLIREISYQKNKDRIDKLMKITSFIKYVGWALSGIFVIVSILIIYNTIRLTIYARSNEIEIMNLVGASDAYVQGPFVLEGVAYGFLASIVSSIILFFAFRYSLPAAGNYLGISNEGAFYSNIGLSLIVFSQLVIGIVLGTVCSVFAVKKHLK
jgi:cell division transport system permease protein